MNFCWLYVNINIVTIAIHMSTVIGGGGGGGGGGVVGSWESQIANGYIYMSSLELAICYSSTNSYNNIHLAV